MLKRMFLISRNYEVQKKVPKAVGLEHFPCEEVLGELGWVIQEKEWLQGQLIIPAYLQGVIEEMELGASQWCGVGGREKTNTDCKRVMLGIKRNFSSVFPWRVRQWKRSP